jgi:hypothetical protein
MRDVRWSPDSDQLATATVAAGRGSLRDIPVMNEHARDFFPLGGFRLRDA